MEEILLSVDVFDHTQISGWCARKIGNSISPCPIWIENGDNSHVVKNFYKRDDLIQHGLGDGALAFRITDDFSQTATVRISDLQTGINIWSGHIYMQFDHFVRISIKNVNNPEECLIYGISDKSEEKDPRSLNSVIYRTDIIVNDERVYYFQILDWPEIINSIEVLCNGRKFFRNIFCQTANMLLSEYWGCLPLSFKQNMIDLAISCNGKVENTYKICCVNPQKEIVFIASSNTRLWLRNLSVNSSQVFDNLYISYPGDVILKNPEINLPTIISNKNGNFAWYNAYVKGGYIKNGWQIKNIFNNVKPFARQTQPMCKGISFYLNIYTLYGAEALIESLYINYLERSADKEGVKNMLASFLKHVETTNVVDAITISISTIKNSEEYKSLSRRSIHC